MAKAATSGQARAFNAMIISRIDEEALKTINGNKFQKAIDGPDAFIHNLIKFINCDCRSMIGPLVANLDYEPHKIPDARIIEHTYCGQIPWQSGRIKLINKQGEGRHISAKEYKEKLTQDKSISIANVNIIEFFETHQYDKEVAKFLDPYKGTDLYEFGTIYQGCSGRKFVIKLMWADTCWRSSTVTDFDDNFILNGLAFVIEKNK